MPLQLTAIHGISLPTFQTKCLVMQFGAAPALVFKTARIDRFRTPPG